jgi:VWFA-related protein
MMPPMTLRDVTFARRTVAIENLLRRDWWGKRDSILPQDEVEEKYAYCYGAALNVPSIGQEMILRRREQQTFDALEELVVSIRSLREERKAVLAITDGWLIYRPNRNLVRPLGDDATPPGNPPLGIDPRNGRLSTAPTDAQGLAAADLRKCELDRQMLAEMDNETRLQTIINEANRSNTSFYPVDPRGLVVFDEPIVPTTIVQGRTPSAPATLRPEVEADRLRARADGLRRLADATDGTAIVGTNNIRDALRRVVDDLSAYYLLGYYSTGKLDGRFHSINVRVKRPGVTVRARRGYQALRETDVPRAPARTAAPAAAGSDAAIASAASSAVAKIVVSARDLPLRVHLTAGWRPGADGRPQALFWTVGEVADRIPGSDLEAIVTAASGELVASTRGRIAPGTTSVILTVLPGQAVQGGDYLVRVRSQSPSGTETVSMPITLPAASQSTGAVFYRRGPSTGNKDVPTADLRFRRNDRLRVEVPATADAASARLLDRTGKPLAVPVTAATRTDVDGTRWATGELALAPLAPADYVVEVSVGDTRTMAAFRIVP